MPHLSTNNKWRLLLPGSLVFLIVLLIAGCGGSGTTSTGSSAVQMAAKAPANANSNASTNQSQGSAASGTSQGKQNDSSSLVSQHYLVKSLKVSMQVKDT